MTKEHEEIIIFKPKIEIANRINENWLKQNVEDTIDIVKSSSSSPFRSPSPLKYVENIASVDDDNNVVIECDKPEFLPYDFFTN